MKRDSERLAEDAEEAKYKVQRTEQVLMRVTQAQEAGRCSQNIFSSPVLAEAESSLTAGYVLNMACCGHNVLYLGRSASLCAVPPQHIIWVSAKAGVIEV